MFDLNNLAYRKRLYDKISCLDWIKFITEDYFAKHTTLQLFYDE